MKEHASTGVVPADAAVEKLVNELAGLAYSYAVELDTATRDADHGELEAVARRITGKLKEATRKALSGAQVVPAFPAIKGAWITGGYVIVTPAGSGPDKAQAVKAAILTAARASLAHDAEMAGLETSIGHQGRLVDDLRPDAERYRAFFDAGLPITFLGEQYHDKAALDAAIDATRGEHDGRA